MPQLQSSFEGTQELGAVPEETYEAHVDTIELNFRVEDGRVIVEAEANKSKNPMCYPIMKIDTGEYAGRKLSKFAALLMLGGTTKENKPMPLYKLIEFLENSNIPYFCAVNGCDLTEKKTYRGTGKDGKKAGNFYCPACQSDLVLKYNTDDFIGRRFKIQVGIEKDNNDRDVNKIVHFLPIGA